MKAEINKRTAQVTDWTRSVIIRGAILLTVFSIQLWLAVFAYLSFYYVYMPVDRYEQPVFFEFSACRRYGGETGCPFPSSNLTFIRDPDENSVLMRGQEYAMLLELQMPQSPVNERQGTFMAKLSLYSEDGTITKSSSRPVTMKYRSWLFKFFDILLNTPFMLVGYREESQKLQVHLLEEFVDHPFKPSIGAVLELQAMKLEVYAATFIIHAQFSGISIVLLFCHMWMQKLRLPKDVIALSLSYALAFPVNYRNLSYITGDWYIMYYWPISTGVLAIMGNFSILSIISLLSWVPLSAYIFREEEAREEDDTGLVYQIPDPVPVERKRQPQDYPRGSKKQVDKKLMSEERQALFGKVPRSSDASSRSVLEVPSASGLPEGYRGTAPRYTSLLGDSEGSTDEFESLGYGMGVVDALDGSSADEDPEPEAYSQLRQRIPTSQGTE